MARFVQSTIVNAPVEKVFAFHEREDALTLLSPTFPPAKLISKSAGGLAPGTKVVLRVGFIDWVALHTDYRKNELFVDEQLAGPFAKWIHRHEFESVDPTHTRLTDRIEYELPGGPVVTACLGWAVDLGLRNMFNHRHRVTRQSCES
jgi:ligand-binding SRPBCC domain-containing protein